MPYSYEFLDRLTTNLKQANPKHNNYFIVIPHHDNKTITINCHISSYSLIALPTIDNHPKFWLKLKIDQFADGHYLVTDDGYVYQNISHDSGLIKAVINNLPTKIKLAAEARGYDAHQQNVRTNYANHSLSLKAHGYQQLVDGINWLITLTKSVFAYQISANNHYYIDI